MFGCFYIFGDFVLSEKGDIVFIIVVCIMFGDLVFYWKGKSVLKFIDLNSDVLGYKVFV